MRRRLELKYNNLIYADAEVQGQEKYRGSLKNFSEKVLKDDIEKICLTTDFQGRQDLQQQPCKSVTM